MSRTLLMALLLAVPLALAGCMNASDDAPASPESAAAAGGGNATAFGSGTPMKAPAQAGVHPFTIPGQTARDAEHVTFEGEYGPDDCTVPIVSNIMGSRWQSYSVMDVLKGGDAVMATVTLTYENTDAAYASLHAWASVPGQFVQDESDVGAGTVTQTLEFQFAFPDGKDAYASVGVACWWAEAVEPVPFTLDVHLVFAENVVPSGNPVLVRVDEGVRELRVTGAPMREDAVVTGHYRLFAPDDSLVGEFALNSDETFDAVRVDAPGEYVLIVDHSEDGMLALGADAAPADPVLLVLDVDWAVHAVLTREESGPVDEIVAFDVPRVPLRQGVWLRPMEEDGTLVTKALTLDLEGPNGLVQHYRIPSYVMARPLGPQFGVSLSAPDADGWEYAYDHHALAVGGHTLTVTAEQFQGEVFRYFVTYLRPGETGVPVPPELAGDAETAPALAAAAPLLAPPVA